ncbi:MAG: putative peptidoglycan glycosyltransferase FtsW [Planctomycetota bacterium]
MRAGHAIAVFVLALLTLGVVMVSSASMQVNPVTAASAGGDPTLTAPALEVLTGRHAVYLGLALLAMVLASRMPVRRVMGLLSRRESLAVHPLSGLIPCALLAAVLCGVLLLVYMPGVQRVVNGSARWVSIPGAGIGFQPSELAKWGCVLLVAWYAAARAPLMRSFWLGLAPGLALLGAVSLLIVVEDLGTGALVAAAGCVVLVAGGARLWQLIALAPIGVVGFVAAILQQPYRIDRVVSFIDPWSSPRGDGYHMIQSLTTIAGGAGTGRGLGHGLQKFGYLPEDTTDFLFAVVCEELGVFGAAIVIGLYAGLVACVWLVARQEREALPKLFTIGVMATLALQTLINLFVVTGMAPTKGIALPLMSAGGTGWIMTAFCLGLVVSIERTQEIETPEPASEAEPSTRLDQNATEREPPLIQSRRQRVPA